MAIILEEENNNVGWVSIFGWLAVIIIIGIAVYYVFVRRPDILPFSDSGFEATQEISGIELDPETLVNNPDFRRRVPHVTIPKVDRVGRENPFLSF